MAPLKADVDPHLSSTQPGALCLLLVRTLLHRPSTLPSVHSPPELKYGGPFSGLFRSEHFIYEGVWILGQGLTWTRHNSFDSQIFLTFLVSMFYAGNKW